MSAILSNRIEISHMQFFHKMYSEVYLRTAVETDIIEYMEALNMATMNHSIDFQEQTTCLRA